MALTLYALLKNNEPGPIVWKDQDDLAFNALKKNLKSLCPWTS